MMMDGNGLSIRLQAHPPAKTSGSLPWRWFYVSIYCLLLSLDRSHTDAIEMCSSLRLKLLYTEQHSRTTQKQRLSLLHTLSLSLYAASHLETLLLPYPCPTCCLPGELGDLLKAILLPGLSDTKRNLIKCQ